MHKFDRLLLHLSLIKGIGPSVVKQLMERLAVDQFLDLARFSETDLVRLTSLSAGICQKLVAGLACTASVEKELDLIQMHKIEWVTLASDQYPVQLKTIHSPPLVLYWQGEFNARCDRIIACVGSRKPGKYGLDVIDFLIPELVHNGWAIVSGGALGIDTAAHQTTLGLQGKTYAILGSGLLSPYPQQNKKLFKSIGQSGGAVISSFPLQQEPLAGNFPARNRIIAGLSKGCLVVQAAEKSGALITARYALEQGRELFAVPGNITDPLSYGCNNLIFQGATPVMKPQDILESLGGYRGEQQTVFKVIQELAVNSVSGKIMDACKTPKTFDDLSALSFCCEEQLREELFSLQLTGKIEQNFMGMWCTL